MPVHVLSTVVLIIRKSKLYYTACGIVTPVGVRPMHRLREELFSQLVHVQWHMSYRSADSTLSANLYDIYHCVCTVKKT